jgi:hypothetical protein
MIKKVAIIPTLNENKNILNEVVRQTSEYVDRVLIVDSSVVTPRINKTNKALIIKERRLGKGTAVKSGISYVGKKWPTTRIIIFLDGDGEKYPSDIPKLLNELKNTDMVIGIRFTRRSIFRLLTNYISTFWINFLTGYTLHDPNSGYFLTYMKYIKKMKLTSRCYEIETDFILNAFSLGLDIKEVPVKSSFTCSKLRLKHMIQINKFFDEWVISNRKKIKNKLIIFFAFMGLVLSKISMVWK